MTTHKRPPRRRVVEKDAAANLDINAFRTAAARWCGPDGGVEAVVERLCTDLEKIALAPNGRSGPIQYVVEVAEAFWPDPEDRPAPEDLARTMAKIGQQRKDAQDLIECTMHGWLEPYQWGKCTECPCQVPNYGAPKDKGGRRRLYCSSACRQRAYRRRKRGIDVFSDPSSARERLTALRRRS